MTFEKLYTSYQEKELTGLWIHYKQIEPYLQKLDANIFKQKIIGTSENNVPIHSIQIGTGKTKILLWSQMHGDESTATKSLFDLFNFVTNNYTTDKQLIKLLNSSTLLFIPMLNPDGALAYTRENADGTDLNRDAQTLSSKEAQLLMYTAKTFNPNFAFNLHDQTSFYNITETDVATISFLSPAAEATRSVTKSRREAMSVIVAMNKSLQNYIPNKVGRYNDTFNENCFGDSFQVLDYPTILIESGYYPGDETREETRKFHFIALLSGLYAIANQEKHEESAYFDIPLNQKCFYDLRIDQVVFQDKLTSIAIRFSYKLQNGVLKRIVDETETISGSELAGKIFHKVLDAKGQLFTELDL